MLWCFCAVCYYQMQQLFNVPEKYNNLSFGQLVVAGVCSRSLTHCCTLLTLEVSCFMEGKDPKKNFVKKKTAVWKMHINTYPHLRRGHTQSFQPGLALLSHSIVRCIFTSFPLPLLLKILEGFLLLCLLAVPGREGQTLVIQKWRASLATTCTAALLLLEHPLNLTSP